MTKAAKNFKKKLIEYVNINFAKKKLKLCELIFGFTNFEFHKKKPKHKSIE